jgi:RNA 3'-terminal phosphate cyclase
LTAVDARQERTDLWRRARALDGVEDQARSPRARLLARRMRPACPTMDYRAVLETPVWASWSVAERRRLAATAGAVLMAERLSSTIDGRTLGGVAAIIGEAALDQVMTLPADDRPEAPPIGSLDPAVLEGLGAAALLAGLSGPTAERLGRDVAEPLLRLDSEQAAAARYQALRIAEAAA